MIEQERIERKKNKTCSFYFDEIWRTKEVQLSDLSLNVNVKEARVRQYEPHYCRQYHSVYFGFCGFFHYEEHHLCMKQHVAVQSNVNASVFKQRERKGEKKTSFFLVTVYTLQDWYMNFLYKFLS